MIRAVLFDAGNTLIRMDYAAIAVELARHGVAVTPEALQRAEWAARVRVDADLFAPASAFSTESRGTTERYTRYVLEDAGVADEDVIARMTEWRRGYNPPVGLWTVAEPEAPAALALVRERGLVAGVVSNSNGTIRRIVESLGLARHLDFVLDSQEGSPISTGARGMGPLFLPKSSEARAWTCSTHWQRGYVTGHRRSSCHTVGAGRIVFVCRRCEPGTGFYACSRTHRPSGPVGILHLCQTAEDEGRVLTRMSACGFGKSCAQGRQPSSGSGMAQTSASLRRMGGGWTRQ